MFASALLASEPRSPADDFWYTAIGTPTVTGSRVNTVTALQLSTVYKCVRAKAETGSMLPLPVYRRLVRGKERAPQHWLSTLLQQPNPWQTGMQWREMMLAHTELRGNGYSHIRWNLRTGQADRLTPLHPDRVKLEVLDNGMPRYRHTDATGREQVYVFGEVLHLQGFAVDGYEGVNPIQAHREAMGAAIVARDYGARYFANSARPPTWLEAPVKFKDDVARRQWVSDFRSAYGGRNAGTTPVLENGMKLHALPVNNSDAQWLEATNASAIDIAGLFRVPPHKIGILSEAKWANIEHQQIDWVTDAILPNCVRLEQTIARDLLLFDDEYLVEHIIEQLLRGDTKTRFEAYGKGIQDGWLLRNEAREKENLNPIDGLDEPLEPMNMAPAGSRGTAQQRGEDPDAQAATTQLDARSLAIQTAAAERVARKESAALQRALRSSADVCAAIDAVFGDAHARFVGEVLVLDAARAAADCQAAAEHAKQLHAAGQLGTMSTQDWEQIRVAQLLRLGTEPEQPVTARDMLGLVRAVAQRPVQLRVEQAGVTVNTAAPHVDVHVPAQTPPRIDVHVPQQAAPAVNIAPPQIDVHVPQQAAPVIHVEAKAAPSEGVMQMQILSMPERVTESTVERDGKGRITHSSQVEKDA